MSGGTCTSLDHIYPDPVRGTPCYCGARTWGGAPRVRLSPLAVGAAVLIAGADGQKQPRVVTAKLRGQLYRVEAPVRGRTLFERDELEVTQT